MRTIFIALFVLSTLGSAQVSAEEWPENCSEWSSMTVERLESYLVTNDVNYSDSEGFSVLMSALSCGSNVDVIASLIESGADVNAATTDEFGLGALAFASASDPSVLHLLVSAGAEVNPKKEGVVSPLLYAVAEGTPEHVRILLEYGADPDASFDGMTVIDLAFEGYRPFEMIDTLETYGGIIVPFDRILESGFFLNLEDGVFESFEFLKDNICIVTDSIFGIDTVTSYSVSDKTITVAGDQNGDLYLTIINSQTLEGSGYARGIYQRD